MKGTLEFKQMITRDVQYIIPYYQRRYVWEEEEWEQLWEDLMELIDNPRIHFFGTLTIMQMRSGPEDISKFRLIDGQQRLTTIFILLILIKEKAKKIGNIKLANDIYNKYLVNSHEEGDNFFKLMPKELDREDYKNLINNPDNIKNKTIESKIVDAYNYFDKKMKESNIEDDERLDKLKGTITNNLGVTNQELDENDDPLQIFDSINGKRKNVSRTDLICNYLFEHIPAQYQEDKHSEFWAPLQQSFKEEELEEYIKDYLIMHEGVLIRENDIYSTLKKNVVNMSAIEILKNIYEYSAYYIKLINPNDNEDDIEIRKRLNRLNRIKITTIYPLLLKFYDYKEKGKINRNNFIETLNIIENYIVRLKICGIPTNSLDRIFASFIPLLDSEHSNIIEGFKIFLQSKNYPKDEDFKIKFKEFSFPENNIMSRLILESFEEDYKHPKEMVSFENITVEHIIPDIMTPWWKGHLGNDYSNVHERYHDNIGNLTLIAKEYNTQASNGDFLLKKEIYKKSHVELNKYFDHLTKWSKEEIEKRANILIEEKAIKIWPNLAEKAIKSMLIIDKGKVIIDKGKVIIDKLKEKLPSSISNDLEKYKEQYEITEKELETLIDNSTKISRGIYLFPNDIAAIVKYSKHYDKPKEHWEFKIDKDKIKNFINKYNEFYVVFKCQDIGLYPIPGNILFDWFKDFKMNDGNWSLYFRPEDKIIVKMNEYRNKIDMFKNKAK